MADEEEKPTPQPLWENYILYRTKPLMYQPPDTPIFGSDKTEKHEPIVSSPAGTVIAKHMLNRMHIPVAEDGFAYALDVNEKYPVGSIFIPETK